MLQIVEALSHLPTDTVATEQELQQLTGHELKERLAAAGGSCDGCLENPELVKALLEVGGSSGTSCCICCDDYVSGDVLWLLPCKVSRVGVALEIKLRQYLRVLFGLLYRCRPLACFLVPAGIARSFELCTDLQSCIVEHAA